MEHIRRTAHDTLKESLDAFRFKRQSEPRQEVRLAALVCHLAVELSRLQDRVHQLEQDRDA